MERRKLLKENEELKQKVAALELNRRGGEIEREKFFEGASWACKQAVNACDPQNPKTPKYWIHSNNIEINSRNR